jgi:toxin ParE1/3/4
MKIHWSPEASADFTAIIQYIHQENPTASRRVAERISGTLNQLKAFPHLGRPGRLEGTREMVFSPLPFVVVYRVKEEIVEIARVLHGAQQWPVKGFHPR